MECKVSDLVKRGHDQAAELKSSCGAVDVRDVAQLISDLATQLDVQLVRSNALAAEYARLSDIAKGGAFVMQKALMKYEFGVGMTMQAEDFIRDVRSKTPATDAFLAEMRAQAHKEGAYFVANRMLAAWDAGFIDDTAKNAADIARMILTSTEFMADAPEGDFDRSFADGVIEDIAAEALLDELDKKQQYIKLRDQENEDIALTVGKLRVELEAAKKRVTEQSAIVAAAEKLVRCKGRYHSELNYRALAKLFGVITPDLPPLVHENVHYADAAEVEITALRQRIAELEAKLETADKLQDSAFRDGLKAGFSYGQTDDQSGFTQCMSAYSTHAGIKREGE